MTLSQVRVLRSNTVAEMFCSDETTLKTNRRFLIQVDPTLESLQSQEDTDGNMQITIEDNGPKVPQTKTEVNICHRSTS